MAISVVIPAYEMSGHGYGFLVNALASVPKGCEIIVSDDSVNGDFESACRIYHPEVKYVKNKRTKGAAGNLNNAIDHATGDIIKVLFQDDTLGPIEPFENIKQWAFCTSRHNSDRGDHVPTVNTDIKALALGNNTYGSPTALAFRKTDLRFDESLKWLLDVDFYARMTLRYGPPEIVDTYVNITEWFGQATYTVCTGKVRVIEAEYINTLYADI